MGARACSDAECGLCGPLDSGSALPWERHSVRERGKEGKSWGGGERAYSTTPSLPNLHRADHLRHGVSSEREGVEGRWAKWVKAVAGTERVRRVLHVTVSCCAVYRMECRGGHSGGFLRSFAFVHDDSF